MISSGRLKVVVGGVSGHDAVLKTKMEKSTDILIRLRGFRRGFTSK